MVAHVGLHPAVGDDAGQVVGGEPQLSQCAPGVVFSPLDWQLARELVLLQIQGSQLCEGGAVTPGGRQLPRNLQSRFRV